MSRVAVGLVAALVTACGGSRPLPRAEPYRPAPAVSYEQALGRYHDYCAGITSFSAAGDLEVVDLEAGRVRHFGLRLVAARPGRLYVKGSVAVVTALEVVADAGRFWFQIPSKRTVWTGAAGGAVKSSAGSVRSAEAMEPGGPSATMDSRREPPAEDAAYEALRPADVVAALLPEPLLAQRLIWESDRTTVSALEVTSEDGRARPARRIELDRSTLRVRRLLFYDAAGDVVTDAKLSGWRGELPSELTLWRREGYEARLRFDRAERNVAVPDRLFAPRTPEGYRVVEVTS